MFFLRIAEALVTSQESKLNAALSSRPQTDEANENGLHSETTSQLTSKAGCLTQTEDNSVHEPMLGDSEQTSRIKLSCPSATIECSTPSPSSATTISVRTISSNSVGGSPQPSLSSPPQTNFNGSLTPYRTEGLLYSLLVNSESNGSHTTRSPFSCASPLLTTPVWNISPPCTPSGMKNTAKPNELMLESCSPVSERKGNRLNQHSSTLISWPHLSSSSQDSGVVANGQHSLHSEEIKTSSAYANPSHRANPLKCKDSTANTYMRPHAFTISSSCNSPLTLRSRLQHRRQPDGSLTDALNHKSKANVRNRSISKSQESTLGFNMYANGSSLSKLSYQNPSAVSSPRAVHHTQSAQARLTNNSGQLIPSSSESHRSSGYCSATSQPSPLSSAMSTDSGLDKPIDLTHLQMPGPVMMEHEESVSHLDSRCRLNRQLVQLAKKTARPVQARVTEWLRQVAEFVATSAPVIHRMKYESSSYRGFNLPRGFDAYSMEAWVSLLAACWHRLLALSMVEHALDLVIVEDKSTDSAGQDIQIDRCIDQMGLPWLLFTPSMSVNQAPRPDRQFANGLIQFMSEIRQATLSAQEFYLLRHVILLTTDEPETIPNIGLNVIKASRYIGPSTADTEPALSAVPNTESQYHSPTPPVSSAEDTTAARPSSTSMTFDLACLVSGLKSLSELCPYQLASLFCAHLRHGSTLNKQFLLELHSRYVNAMVQLDAVHPSTNNGSLCSSHTAPSVCQHL